MTYKFYDTSSLLLKANELFKDNTRFAISSITLGELEGIKTSSHKDNNIKYAARQLLHSLNENMDKFDIWIYKSSMINPIVEKDLEVTNDTKILACAIDYDTNCHPDETVFVTNDMALMAIANLFFGEDSIECVNEEKDEYCGYKEVYLNDGEMSELYSHFDTNHFNLQINEYLLIHDSSGEIVDRLCWTESGYRHLNYSSFNSKYFGEIKPMKGDPYQSLAADSFVNNKITMVKGPAGTGKTFLSLGFLLNRLEKNKIDKIIIFCNTIATKGSAKLGLIIG